MANLKKWTAELRKKAAKALLDLSNSYEVTQKKWLREASIIFREDGSAKYVGKAHDYTVWISQL